MDFSEDQIRYALNRCQIPLYMHNGIIEWILNGIKPGDFLTAIIENDLKESFARADENNIIRMQGYLMFFYNAAPGMCWGSKERVEKWAREGGLRKVNSKPVELAEEYDDGE